MRGRFLPPVDEEARGRGSLLLSLEKNKGERLLEENGRGQRLPLFSLEERKSECKGKDLSSALEKEKQRAMLSPRAVRRRKAEGDALSSSL